MHPVKRVSTGPYPIPTSGIPGRLEAVASDRAIALMRMAGDLQVHVLIRLDGALDEARLARALRLLCDIEPVLGCRFVPGWHHPHWERLPNLDKLPLCELEQTTATTDEAAQIAYLATPPDPDHLPMLRARIFRQPQGDTLVLKINHLATDGGGSKECAYLLAALYNRLAEEPDLRPEPNLTGRRSLRQVAEQLTVGQRARLLAEAPWQQWRRHHPRRFWRAPHDPSATWGGDAPSRTFVIRRLGEAGFRRAKEWGQRRRATVNDLVNAAYLQALIEWIRPPADLPLRLRTTVDLRRYLPTGRTEAVCNCSGFSYPDLGPLSELRGANRFSSLVSRMSEEMARMKRGLLGLHEWALLGPGLLLLADGVSRSLLRRGLTPDRTPEMFLPALTNIGRIHPERLRFGGAIPLDAHATASVIYPPGLALSVTGFGDSLSLSCGFCASALPRPQVARLLDRVLAILARPQDAAVQR